jgi:5-methylthioadenosine/S-adenosylhomocysteine deaminase
MKTPNMTPIFTKETVVSDLVYSASSSNVDTTIVDGNILMQNRKLTTLNQEEVMSKARQIAERLARA